MDHHPVLIFSYHTHLGPRRQRAWESMTQPPACKCVIWTWNHICVDVLRRTTSEKKAITARLNLAHLGLHLPTGNGCFAIIAGFELQGDRAWADVGNGHVGRRTGKFYEGGEERAKLGQRKKERLREHITNTNVGLFCLAAFFGLWTFHLPHRPLVAAQILHMDDFLFFYPLGDLTHFSFAPNFSKEQIRFGKQKRCLYTVHRWRQCHECQLPCADLEIPFNLISYCLHLSWGNNKNGLFPGSPGGENKYENGEFVCLWQVRMRMCLCMK